MEALSFLDEGTTKKTKKLKCSLTRTHPLSITVANGQKALCKYACVGFCWQTQGKDFEADLCLLKLGAYDMVLGVDWMREVSPICFDFNQMEVTFEKEGRRMTLTSSAEAATCKLITSKRLHKLFKSKWTQVA